VPLLLALAQDRQEVAEKISLEHWVAAPVCVHQGGEERGDLLGRRRQDVGRARIDERHAVRHIGRWKEDTLVLQRVPLNIAIRIHGLPPSVRAVLLPLLAPLARVVATARPVVIVAVGLPLGPGAAHT
jgi:hypothetical protein